MQEESRPANYLGQCLLSIYYMLHKVLNTADVKVKKHCHCIYPREMKASDHTKTCTRILIAALLVIAENWKQPKSPSAGE